MKKNILIITAMIIGVGAYAQDDQKRPTSADTSVYLKSTNKHADGFMMKNGKLMCVKDGKIMMLKRDTTLSNGTVVMSNGHYMRSGESKMMFKEGQHMDMSGKMVSKANSNDQVKKWDRNKKMYLVDDSVKTRKNNQ